MRAARKGAAALTGLRGGRFEVERVRRDFPILQRTVHGKPLVYLDNAATSQKPQSVIDSLTDYYAQTNSNIHRGIHFLSEEATHAYEQARGKVRSFLNAADDREIVFVRGTTEAINLVAQSYGRAFVKPGDEIVLTTMEHHSNIVPWQILGEQTGARLRVVPINDEGELLLEEFEPMLTGKTRLVAVAHVSNALGTVNPIKRIVQTAHRLGIPVLVDGAQAVPHMRVDVRDLDCDFYAFSGHKLFGPTGVGVLYAKSRWLERMPPYQGGGSMISLVTFEKTHYADIPQKFEAGTPDIAGGIGLGAAIDYLRGLDFDAAATHEQELLDYGTRALAAIDGVRIVGRAKQKAGVLSFVLEGVHPHDIGTILDREGVAIRAGHHCAMPAMQRFGVPATARASLALYNTREDLEALVRAVHKVKEVFG
jgi:cysteine desulfurase / selenocysteine lyase